MAIERGSLVRASVLFVTAISTCRCIITVGTAAPPHVAIGAVPANDRLLALCNALDDRNVSASDRASLAAATISNELAEPTVPFEGLGGGLIDSDYEIYNMMIAILNHSDDQAFVDALNGELTKNKGLPVEPFLAVACCPFGQSPELVEACISRVVDSVATSSRALRLCTLRAMRYLGSGRSLEVIPCALADQKGVQFCKRGYWNCLSWDRARVIVRFLGGTATGAVGEDFLTGLWGIDSLVGRVVDEAKSDDPADEIARLHRIRQFRALIICNSASFSTAFGNYADRLSSSISDEISWSLNAKGYLDSLAVSGEASDEDSLNKLMVDATAERWVWVLYVASIRRSKSYSSLVSNWLQTSRGNNPPSAMKDERVSFLLALAAVRSGVDVVDSDLARLAPASMLSIVEGPGAVVVDLTHGELIPGEDESK